MAQDFLPSKFLNPTRTQIASDWRRDYLLRNPTADIGNGSQPMLDSLTMADTAIALYAYATQISSSVIWTTASGPNLRQWALAMGTDYLPATGAVGFVIITASAGGTFIQAGDQLSVNGLTYKALSGGFFQSGALVGIQGLTTGPQTNQDAGSVLTWSTPRPGLGPQATVAIQPDGTGLTGGTNQESDSQLQQRLSFLKSNPPGSGNDAMIQALVAKTPGVPVQQCFTFPAILGPGTVGVTVTLRPSQTGASRLPNAGHLALVLAYLQQNLPASDGILMCTLAGSPLNLITRLQWATNAPGWVDASPFPLYQTGGGNNWAVTSTVVPTPSTFNIKSPTDTTVPQVGQNIGLFNLASQTFSRKKILSAVAAGGGYTITVDPTGGFSDLNYTPVVGQLVSPWSDSLNSLVAPILAYLDSVGPGEQVASFYDAGLRQKRSPASPGLWTSQINNRILGGPANASQPVQQNSAATPTLLQTLNIADIELAEINNSLTIPYSTPVGIAGVSANLLQLAGAGAGLGVYPE